jgi:phage-related protein
MHTPRLRWRDYRTESGARPVKDYIHGLSDADQTAIAAAMKEVTQEGLRVARKLTADLFEIRAIGLKAHYRLIFAPEAKYILLAVDIFDKDTQKLPAAIRKRAEGRLRDWRQRGRAKARTG